RDDPEAGRKMQRRRQTLRGPEAFERFGARGHRITGYFRHQRLDHGIDARGKLLAKKTERMRTPGHEVQDARAQSVWMENEAYSVDRLAQQFGRTALVKLRQGCVREHDVPMPVDGEGGIGRVRLQDAV